MVEIKGWPDLLPDWVAIWDGQGEAEGDGEGKGGDGGERWGGAGCCWWALVGTGPTKTWENTPKKKKKNKASAAASLSQPPPNQPPLPSPALSCPARGSFTIFDSFLEQKSGQKTKGGPPLPETRSPCLSPDRFPARAQPIPPRLCDAFRAKSLFFHFSR